MSKENHNNRQQWKTKLEELNTLPGDEEYNKNTSWEKLHQKLDSHKNKKVMWYWLAAACLLFVSIIFVLNSNKENQVIKNEVVQKQPHELISSPAEIIKKEETKVIIPALFEDNEPKTFDHTKSKITSSEISAQIENNIHVTDTISKYEAIAKSKDIVSKPADSSLNMVTETLSKRKLKVVHINELGEAEEESPDMAHLNDIHSFQLKIARQEVFVNPTNVSTKKGFIILTQKNSPN